jgi:hypothetical protein
VAVAAILGGMMRVTAAVSLSLTLRGAGCIILSGAIVGAGSRALAGSRRRPTKFLGTCRGLAWATRIGGRSGRPWGPGRWGAVLRRGPAGLGGGS